MLGLEQVYLAREIIRFDKKEHIIMSFMDSIIGGLKLDSEGFDDNGYLDDEDAPVEIERTPAKPDNTEEGRKTPVFAPRNTASKNKKLGNGMEVCVIKPTTFEETREITDTLLSNRTVVLNMEGLDMNLAQRIIDFTSGSTYAIHGNLQKISHYIFIVTPASVDVSGDFPTLMNDSFEVPKL